MASALWQRFVGKTVDGKYLLHRLLGAGAHGGVFEAEPLSENSVLKHVALKLIEPAVGREEQQLAEITQLVGLSHPALLRTFTPGISNIDGARMLYLPTEIADESLDARIAAQILALDEARDIGAALATALVYLHEQTRPLVHRDVKPANAMRIGARWKLGDFGLLRSVSSRAGIKTRTITSTTEYAPPESYDGLISPAWDVWSLGILLHQATTGAHPFPNSETPMQLMHAVCSAEPEYSELLPPELRPIVKACLDKDPSVRWTSERVLDALEELDTAGSFNTLPQIHISRRRQGSAEVNPAPAESGVHSNLSLMELITVSAAGDADVSTITEAVRHAAAGATIVVRPGHYSGTVLVKRQIEIIGEGPAADIILEVSGHEALVIDAENVLVRGITLVSRADMHQPKHNGVSIRKGAVRIEGCDISCNSLAGLCIQSGAQEVVISECAIHDCKAAGVLFEEGTSGSVYDCTLAANFGPAIHVKSGGEHQLHSCLIYDGRESGVLIDKAAVCAIQSCTIHDNQGAGIIVQESSTAAISSCAIFANKHSGINGRARSTIEISDSDIYENVLSGAAFSGSQVNVARCKVHDSRSNGLAVSEGANCAITDSEVSHNGFAGIKVSHGGRLRVKSCSLHNGKRNAAVIQDDSVASFSDCDIYGNDQVSILVEEGGRAELSECRLHDNDEGCIAYRGEGTIEKCILTNNTKSAIEVVHAGNAAVRDCTINNNRMPAILVHGKSEAVIERCKLSHNDMPAIAVGESSKALISECTIQSGVQVGMVFWDSAKGIVDRCEITGCGMDGLRIMQLSNPVVNASRIHSNAQYGIHVSGQSAGEIIDCDLTGNAAGPAFVEAGCTTASSGNIV